MAIGYKARKRLALLILLVGMPVYVVAAVSLVGWLERPSFLMELAIYVGLGCLWVLPFRFVFRGIGQADPNEPADGPGPSA
jgi:CDP-diglyceride synthetase